MKNLRLRLSIYALFVAVLIAILVICQPDSTLHTLTLGALASTIAVLLPTVATHASRLRLYVISKTWYRNTPIRFSISYLFRIKLDDKYLLIHSSTFNHYQPIGGVYKRLTGATAIFENLGVLDDTKMPIDDDRRGDLRVLVPGKYVTEFLNWFDSQTNREIGPWREFYQELVETSLLPKTEFRFVMFRWLRRFATDIQFSSFMDCYELKVADIFEPVLTPEQEAALKRKLADEPRELRLVTEEDIRRRGASHSDQEANVAENAAWIR